MKFGDIVLDYTKSNQAVFLGTVKLKDIWKHRKREKVRWWMGTDVLTLFSYPVGKFRLCVFLHRIKTIFVSRFFEENWFVSYKLMKEVPEFYSKRLKLQSVRVHLADKIKKMENPLVVGYYLPYKDSKFNRWVYGADILEALHTHFRYRNIIFLRYSGREDVRPFLSIIDLYIRPSRHDGTPRIILLCEENNIPYYWDSDFESLIEFITQMEEERGD